MQMYMSSLFLGAMMGIRVPSTAPRTFGIPATRKDFPFGVFSAALDVGNTMFFMFLSMASRV